MALPTLHRRDIHPPLDHRQNRPHHPPVPAIRLAEEPRPHRAGVPIQKGYRGRPVNQNLHREGCHRRNLGAEVAHRPAAAVRVGGVEDRAFVAAGEDGDHPADVVWGCGVQEWEEVEGEAEAGVVEEGGRLGCGRVSAVSAFPAVVPGLRNRRLR
ncbi:hypothetical protein BO99DRAFT_398711 [Aspergillus violaceofuscus CBS 115571]|uniref:Uncharacterized protein n=1 Tax=Aspergillus violaceofuscus (strain CBS 115571) TaxID=1450538 RepID=A0A2V5IJY7_ASPV1|nr:hypothetical protein BO99DRAFT_398711 [Aspergillus violaceofuscus CBS 115571]